MKKLTELHKLRIGQSNHDNFSASQDQGLLKRMQDLYAAGMTLQQVGEEVGKPQATVHRWLKNSGVQIRRAGQHAKGRPWPEARRSATPKRDEPARPVVDGKPLVGYELLTHRAIGNRSVSRQGYVVVRTGRKQRQYEHILIAEKVPGRPLLAGEVVHHINCDRADNRHGNLLICTQSYHMQLHARMRRDPHWREVERAAREARRRTTDIRPTAE